MAPKRKNTAKKSGITKSVSSKQASNATGSKAATRRQPSRKVKGAQSAAAPAGDDQERQSDADDQVVPPQERANEDSSEEEDGLRVRGPGKRKRSAVKDAADDSSQPPKKARREDSPVRNDNIDAEGWPEVQVWAEVQRDVDITYEEKTATLRVELQVHKDPGGFKSRLGYRARLSVVQRATSKGKKKAAGVDQVQHAGYIHSWRINKPTAAQPSRNKTAWTNELLKVDIDAADPEIRETALCVKALYFKNGNPQKAVRGRNAELVDNSLIFVQMVYILEAFQKKGLLRHALSTYHKLLMELPEWFAFTGTIVLVPSKPEGPRGESWAESSDEEVEQILSRAYNNHGQYEIWIGDANVGGNSVMVMGRVNHIED